MKNNNISSTEIALEMVLEEDGVTHIRIDNRGSTDLGIMLDAQYISPFIHPLLGQFNTTEGFWHYISMSKPNELFRVLNGHECRLLIRDLKKSKQFKKINIKDFYKHIQYANYLKIESNDRLKKLFIESTLPFKMYYFIKNTNKSKKGINIVNTSILNPRLNNLIELRDHYHQDDSFVMDEPPMNSLKRLLK